jgi:hypothetical protein
MTSRTAWLSAAIGMAFMVVIMQSTVPAAAGPFTNMAGSWSGSGIVYLSTGRNERLRCRASYGVERDGDQLNLAIRCASDSYKFDLTGFATSSAGVISGQWSEPNYNAAGTLSGRASDGRISATAVGSTISAFLTMTTRGNRQSVTIRPEGTEITQVALTLTRR